MIFVGIQTVMLINTLLQEAISHIPSQMGVAEIQLLKRSTLLIALLIYSGLVKVVVNIGRYWRTKTLYSGT